MNTNISTMKLSELDNVLDIPPQFWANVRMNQNGRCWNWVGFTLPNGYGRVHIKKPDGTCQNIYAHRMSYLLEYGEIPNKLEVCHSCDNPSCINPGHLWLGTHKENMQDAINKGRLNNAGEHNGAGKLTQRQVDEIRERHRSGEKVAILANEYGIKLMQTYRILRGESWAASCSEPAKLSPRHKWTEAEIADVHSRRKNGETLKSIADLYGVDFTRIWQIEKHGR